MWIVGIGFFLVGLIQLAAIYQGFSAAVGDFFGFILAFIVGEMPLLGTIMGVRGAVRSWGWPVGWALALMLGIPAISFIVSMIVDKIRGDV